jgi:hypothetical protein
VKAAAGPINVNFDPNVTDLTFTVGQQIKVPMMTGTQTIGGIQQKFPGGEWLQANMFELTDNDCMKVTETNAVD